MQTESDVNMSEAVSARPPGSTSKAVEKKETEPEAVELPGFEHCQDWDTLVPEVKSHLASMTDSPEGDPPQAADAISHIHRAAQENCSDELAELEHPKRLYDKDEEGVTSFATRICNQLGPVWIPKDSRGASLIVESKHKKIPHDGKRFTKAVINENYFIQKHDSECVGIDYIGPITNCSLVTDSNLFTNKHRGPDHMAFRSPDPIPPKPPWTLARPSMSRNDNIRDFEFHF